MQYKRRYLQFADLVFGGVDVIDEDDYSVSFKTFDTEYGFSHGSYAPIKKKGGLIKSGRVSMTILLRMKKIPCEDRPYYVRFVKSQLTTQGRLWAIQDNRLVWAWAYLTSYSESGRSRKDELEIDVNFDIPEGVWHKADRLKTFIVPFDPCEFMECYDWKEVNPCHPYGDCCSCGEPVGVCDCCSCDKVEQHNALCYFRDMQDFYECDGGNYKIIYSCVAAEKYFTDPLNDEHVGQKICSACGGMIAGQFYSETDIPTEGIRITIHGPLHNPYIEINGNGNTILGDFDGFLVINPDGSVYTYKDDCGTCDPLPVDVWSIPDGMSYGWTVEQGKNMIRIDTGTCCTVCAWIEEDALTF